MAVTIYLDDGDQIVIPAASAVVVAVTLAPGELRRVVVCRDASGRAIADFAADAVLAFRGPRPADQAAPTRRRAAARLWPGGT